MRLIIFGILITLGSFACSTKGKDQKETKFPQYEHKLFESEQLQLTYTVTSEGSFQAQISGNVSMDSTMISFSGKGSFGSKPVHFRLYTFKDSTKIETQDTSKVVLTPDYLKESITVGLSRMGILHNISRVINAQLPDHSSVDPKQWVTTRSSEEKSDGSTTKISIFVNEHFVAKAQLTFIKDVLPTQRIQTVYFGTDSMSVKEMYQWK